LGKWKGYKILELQLNNVILDYCLVEDGELHSICASLGPMKTITPLHHDSHHNLLTKVIFLSAPKNVLSFIVFKTSLIVTERIVQLNSISIPIRID
jgi:hypothetical protein